MAKFLVLIYGDEQTWADLPAEWHSANGDRHQELIASAGSAILGVNELEPPANSVSIRGDPSGNPTITNGPFHVSPEIVGGYYLLEARDIHEATELAARIPEATAAHGGVEIRPIATPG